MQYKESRITIEGETLTVGQAMTLRVAITAFHFEMSHTNALGDSPESEVLRKAYFRQCDSLLNLLSVK